MDTIKDKFLSINDEYDYDLIKQQIDTTQPVEFGHKIKVLLMTDRLHGCAAGLKEYLENSTDITVSLVNGLDGAAKAIRTKHIEFLIIIGYLRSKRNYEVVQYFKRVNPYSSVIIYAHTDGCINNERLTYGITFTYHRKEPVGDFISFMRILHEIENQRLYVESIYVTREEVSRKVLQDMRRAEEEEKREDRQAGMFAVLLRRFGLA